MFLINITFVYILINVLFFFTFLIVTLMFETQSQFQDQKDIMIF